MKKLPLISLFALSIWPFPLRGASGELYQFNDAMTLETLESIEVTSGAQNSDAAMEQPYVVIVSLDGFRYDYPTLHHATNLQAMMESGSYARRLLPSFPSVTFPNHYTIATGLYPSHSGLVGNTMYSREKDAVYRIRDKEAVRDGSWYGGTPLWSLAETQGMLSASFFWVGSEAGEPLTPPAYYFRYDSSVPYALRVAQVEKWLELPEKERPHLIFLYYSLTDSAGHLYGPESEATGKAVRYVDAVVGELRDYIGKSELPINLIVLADHGMAPVSNVCNVRDFVDLGENFFAGLGPVAMIYTKSPAEKERIYKALVNRSEFATYTSETIPDYLNYRNKDRIGDIILISTPPTSLEYMGPEKAPYSRELKGTHGFDPYAVKEMGAIFIAEGPNIESGLVLPPVENIHIYPFVASILGLKVPDSIDGKAEKLAPLLKQTKDPEAGE
ncbi:MAG: alkaline phosphatase family protein [Opitutales bacterium]|nr:alkaline phosphatase family protein [Opitutales bacterium]